MPYFGFIEEYFKNVKPAIEEHNKLKTANTIFNKGL
jgi:hypothetical protein